MRAKKLIRQHGFSLIQASLLLAVGGLVLASTLPGSGSIDDAAKRALTLKRMQKIEEATQNFMATNNRRPCPASGLIALGAATFGLENGAAGSCATANFGPVAFNNAAQGPTGSVIAGTVPVRALGLPDEYALDGYGRRFMYVVERNVTSVNSCRNYQAFGTSGSVRVLDASTSTVRSDYVMWALISYGKDGHGAFPGSGSAIASRINTYTTDANTLMNAFVNAAFTTSFTGNVVKRNMGSGFDDIVWYHNDTKNTCCVGLRCNQGFRFDTASPSFDVNNGIAYASGDIDGDGIDEIVYANPLLDTEQIRIIYGSQTGWPVAPSTYSGAISITNDFGDSYTGVSIAVDDATGDGRKDILINAVGYTYLIFDMIAGEDGMQMSELIANAQATQIENFGSTKAGAVAIADIDNDGFKDLIITPVECSNIVEIIWGRTMDDWDPYVSALNVPTDGVYLYSIGRNWACLQHSVDVGKFNNDNFYDIITGGPLDTNAIGTVIGGSVNVVFGKTRASWAGSTDVDTVVTTGTAGAYFYSSLAGDLLIGEALKVADMDNDGIDDIVVVSDRSIWGIKGKAAAWAAINDLNGAGSFFRINTHSSRPAVTFTWLQVWVDDVNGDSVQDIMLTAPYANISRSNSGVTYGIFGPTRKNGWTADGWAANPSISMFCNPDVIAAGGTCTGGNNYCYLGNAGDHCGNYTKGFLIEGTTDDYIFAVKTTDLNRDNKRDLIIGAPGYGGSDAGAVYVVFGRSSSPWRSRYDATYKNVPKIDATDLSQ